MGLLSKFGKYPKCPTAGHIINGKPSIDLTKFPLPSPGKSLVVLGDNSLHPPTEVLSLLLSSHQRRFWISRSEIGYESVLCSGNKRRSKLQTIKMPIKGRPLSTKIKPKVRYALSYLIVQAAEVDNHNDNGLDNTRRASNNFVISAIPRPFFCQRRSW